MTAMLILFVRIDEIFAPYRIVQIGPFQITPWIGSDTDRADLRRSPPTDRSTSLVQVIAIAHALYQIPMLVKQHVYIQIYAVLHEADTTARRVSQNRTKQSGTQITISISIANFFMSVRSFIFIFICEY